jgi:hypothetical protein
VQTKGHSLFEAYSTVYVSPDNVLTRIWHFWQLCGHWAYLENGGTLEHAQRMAAHSSRGRRPKRAEKHVSVLDAILTPALVGLYEARLGKPIRVTRS